MKKFISSLFLTILISSLLSAQIKIKEIQNYKISFNDSLFFKISETRKVESLNGVWDVYIPGKEESKSEAVVPSLFEGNDELIFEKKLEISKPELVNNRFLVSFLGLNYSAEISLNDIILYKNPGGEIPFVVELPRTILKSGNENILKVKVKHELDSEATIPTKQSFLQPVSKGGIFRDVLLYKIPNVAISNEKYTYQLSDNFKTLSLNCSFEITKEFINGYNKDTTRAYFIESNILDPNGKKVSEKKNVLIDFENGNDANVTFNHKINNPVLWNNKYPKSYRIVTTISSNGRLVDRVIKEKSFYSLKVTDNSILLNGKRIDFKGTCYIQSYKEYGSLISLGQIKKDIELIKETGFNSVRFSKQMPHPYALYLSQKQGLLTFVDIPLNSIPEAITRNPRFKERARGYLKYLTDSYSKIADICGVGLGSGYLSNSPVHNSFLENLSSVLSDYENITVYTSFVGVHNEKINNIDLYGIELFNKKASDYSNEIKSAMEKLGPGRVFISEATYPNFNGNTSGYFNPNSFEAQAKYFEDLLNYVSKEKISGYFINSFFDYRGHFPAFITGFNENNNIQIGLVDENRVANRIAYKVVSNKLKNGERITIPMGSKKDDMPVFFIVGGMGIVILIVILISSRRKIREDATRALLRPYNFYADLRDQRILSGFHINFILLIILAGSFSLLVDNFIFFLRTNFLVQRVVEAFGSEWFINAISYLAWNPLKGFTYIFVLTVLTYFLISVIIHAFSFFVKNKVLFSSIYYMVTWATLPFLSFLVLGMLSYQILSQNVINLYLYITVILILLWVLQRLFKGIYVLFDVRGSLVYIWGFLFLTFVFGGLVIYFQLTESTLYYIINAYKQYILM